MQAALEREGFAAVDVLVAAPEMPDGHGGAERVDRFVRTLAYRVAGLLPGGTRTPLAFNLQAYARRD
jgi:hypothetical protein